MSTPDNEHVRVSVNLVVAALTVSASMIWGALWYTGHSHPGNDVMGPGRSASVHSLSTEGNAGAAAPPHQCVSGTSRRNGGA
jgi:hypothetical protein